MLGWPRGILAAAMLLAFGCNSINPAHHDISITLAARTKALNSRDMQQYLSVVSSKYSDKGKDIVLLTENLKKNFSDFEQIDYEVDEHKITVSGNSAEAVGSYRMKVRVRGKSITLNGVERLKLAKEAGGWKIIAGI